MSGQPVPRERRIGARDSLALFVRDWGSGTGEAPPVLCLPGLTRNSNDFITLARRLAPTRRVVCPDLRGRGRSGYTADWRDYTPGQYLDDIRHILAALGLGRVIVVGVSLGGLLGLAMTAAMPGAVAGLVINDVGPDIEPAGSGRIMAYVGKDRPQPDWPSAVAHLRQTFTTLSLESDEDWLSFARGTFREGGDGRLHFDWDPAIIRPLIEPLEPVPDLWNLWRAARRIPMLAIRGGASDILSADSFARMKAEKPDLIQVTLPGTGHCPTLNEPPVRKAIDDFLDTL